MLSHYGWLMLYGEVDDHAAEKHGGDVYIHKDDIVNGATLCTGDIVSFYLYSDEQGLGAEECQVEQKAASRTFNANAVEFVPLAEGALIASVEELVMPTELESADIDHVTKIRGMCNVFQRLSQVFSSEEDSEDEECGAGMAKCGALSSEGSTYDGVSSDSDDDASSDDGSYSETEHVSAQELAEWTNRCPPGMPLPLHFRPPPGLIGF